MAEFRRAVDMGFFCYSTFAQDPWLDPLRSSPSFVTTLERARLRQAECARTFRDAGGERLLAPA